MNIELQMVEVSEVNVDARYQRAIRPARQKQMEKAFDQGASKAISLSRRADGSLWVYDGNNTLELFKLRGIRKIPAVIVAGTPEQEAGWFGLMNGSGPIKANPAEKQTAAHFAGDPLALDAQLILDLYGIQMATGGADAGKTRSIDFIKTCLKSDRARLCKSMEVIRRLWSTEREAWSRTIMRGMWEIAGTDLIEEVERGLLKHKVTPRRVLDMAQGMQLATGEPGGGMAYSKKAILQLARTTTGQQP